jgi:hypothetical protein
MWLSRLSAFFRGAWRMLPVETLIVAMAATGAIGLVHDRQVWFLRLFLGGVLLTPLAFAAHRLGRRVQLCASSLATAGVLAVLAVGLPDLDALSDPAFSWPCCLAFLAALLAPFVASGRRFTRFVRRFFEETTTWGLLWLGAVAAAGVVFTALKGLFDLHVENLAVDAVIVLTSGFILVYLHRLTRRSRGDTGAHAGIVAPARDHHRGAVRERHARDPRRLRDRGVRSWRAAAQHALAADPRRGLRRIREHAHHLVGARRERRRGGAQAGAIVWRR